MKRDTVMLSYDEQQEFEPALPWCNTNPLIK